MNSLPTVAVVILNWNGKHWLKQFLPSVLATNYSQAYVYVADNGSTDGSIEYVKVNFPSIKLVVNDKNYGFAGGYNKALQQINADYYVLLNSDVAVTSNWLQPLVDCMQASPNVGACQPKILAFNQPLYFEYAGASGGFIDAYGYPFCRGRIFDTLEEDRQQYNQSIDIFWATGAALCIRADLYHRIGGLDDDFFAHMEEIDLCWRIKRAGYHIKVCPEAEVYHVGGGTLPKSKQKIYLNFRNNLVLLLKNLPRNRLAFILLVRMNLDFVALLKALVAGNWQEVVAIHEAHKHFVGRLRFWYKKRKQSQQQIQKVTIGSSTESIGCYTKSMVWQYFIKGKKKYSEL